MKEKLKNETAQIQNLIRTFQLKITRVISIATDKENITMPQFRVVLALGSAGPSPMNVLAKLLGVTMPAITHLADKLESENVITRCPNPKDRRSFIIELTQKGKEIQKATQGKMLNIFTDVVINFSEVERTTISKFYQQMNKKLDEEIG